MWSKLILHWKGKLPCCGCFSLSILVFRNIPSLTRINYGTHHNRGDVELGDALFGAVEGKASAIEATLGPQSPPVDI
jgi:hypothetical protein